MSIKTELKSGQPSWNNLFYTLGESIYRTGHQPRFISLCVIALSFNRSQHDSEIIPRYSGFQNGVLSPSVMHTDTIINSGSAFKSSGNLRYITTKVTKLDTERMS